MKGKNMFRRTKGKEAESRELVGLSAVFLILFLAGFACADTVTLDLFSIGCPTEFGPYWQADFDLGVTFTQINHVYIDWSGGITAALVQYYDSNSMPEGEPQPIDVGVYASLGFNPGLRRIEVWGGEEEYSLPYIFNSKSEILVGGTTTWSDLLDGTGKITVGYTAPWIIGGDIMQHGSIDLNKATLVIDGNIVPEPATFLLIVFGAIGPRLICNRRHSRNNAQ
jgi:hypothetical protein